MQKRSVPSSTDTDQTAEITVLLTGDGAQTSIAQDEFGLEEISKSIASTLVSRLSSNGYAIGLEGTWGSGKTSLSNFVAEEIEKTAGPYHKLIRFQPWLVGTKRSLLQEFFQILIVKIKEVGDSPTVRTKLQATNPSLITTVIEKIERYRSYLDVTASIATGAAAFDQSGYTKIGALVLKGLSKWAALIKKKPVILESMKSDIEGDLRTLQKFLPDLRFTVVIDDLDRLDPDESIEILRLIKAVADFPSIVYLVCFDIQVLEEQVSRTIGVCNGRDYIQKIFQVIVTVPPQEAFALRRFVRKLLTSNFPEELGAKSPAEVDRQSRGEVLFDNWVGRFVRTPRDAVRLCESVKLGWPHLQSRADFFDYVWLQLIKLRCDELYNWTRDYLVHIGSYRDGGQPTKEEVQSKATVLGEILMRTHGTKQASVVQLGYFLPGIKTNLADDQAKVFEFGINELSQFEGEKRLGSPSHWRLYFAFDMPSYALGDDATAKFLSAVVSDLPTACEILKNLHAKVHDQPGYYLQIFLDRLVDRRETLSTAEQIGIARALAEVMDEVIEPVSVRFGLDGPWRKSLRLLGPAVAPHLASIIEGAPSVNWLAEVMRDQGYALGIPDPSRARPDRQWLKQEQFDDALARLIDRFRKIGLSEIFRKPAPLDILYCWAQLADESELRALFATELEEDERFIEALEAMCTWMSSSGRGLHQVLHSRYVSHFMDADAARSRLESLSTAKVDESIRTRAAELLVLWDEDLRD